ncbi:MAG: hypothetical protein FWH26_00810 [Oscillospiraceae bacterium]|nr:hypothetical protein [Oscillospiraceae bacterium]
MPSIKKIPWKNIFNRTLSWASLFLLLSLVFLLLITAAYAIPNRWIEKNTRSSMEHLAQDPPGFWPTMPYGRGVTMDYRTDQRMLDHALVPEGESLFRAAQVPAYARYWHGYQVYLRPMLIFGDLQMLRYWNGLFQFALIALLCALIAKRLQPLISVAFGLSLAFAGYIYVPLSFQFSSVFLVMLVSSNLLLLLYDKERFRKWLPQYFFVIGAVTVFLDFLTAPIITLGVPLVLVLLLRMKDASGNTGTGRNALGIAGQSAAWGAGYVTLWFSKWIISSLLLGRNMVRIGLEQIFFRTGASADGYISIDLGESVPLQTWDGFLELNRFQAAANSLFTLFRDRDIPIFLAAVCLACLGACLISKRARDKIPQITPLLLIALIPFCWMAVLGQHTLIHSFFVYRNWMVSLFALMCVPGYLLREAFAGSDKASIAAKQNMRK